MQLFMSGGRTVDSRPQPLVKAGLAIVIALAMQTAHAQTSLSASALSEYSVRGVSLSRGLPVPQLRIDYDAVGGWYAGALASRVDMLDSPAHLQLVGYGGYAHTLESGLTWEAGALDVNFVRDEKYRYHEFFAGLSRDGIGGRLYFSPSYYGGGKTVYTEVNGSYPLRDGLTLIGHVGLLHPFGSGEDEARNRVDLRLALGFDLDDCNVQLALLATAPKEKWVEMPHKLAVSVTYAF
jgi:uncharacterized protein (TIGR02001 family)